jgi:hypothetical protein
MTHEPHFGKRCQQRKVTLPDWKKAIRLAHTCSPYADRPSSAGGTSWRVTGPDVEGDDLTVAVEAYGTPKDKRALLVTVFA